MDISGKEFSVSSRYTLEIAHSRVKPDVLNFHGREALSEPYKWRIEFTAPQSDMAPDDVLLKYASLKMLSGRVVYGVITRFEWLGTSADQTHYAVTLASRLALLSLTRRCAVFSREDAEPGYHYLWVRQAKPYAGDAFGWHTPLLDGTEVSIAFDDGNIDRPYIAHAFHDAEHADIVTRDNRSQNILRTAARNELRMEDLRGQEHVALTTPYGASSLNQGHITDEQSQQRGAGFELRTDEYGVIRVAKGLFVTADGQTKAAGEVLEREAAQREIEICLNQIQQLADAAAQAQALEADIASQMAMFNARLKPLNQMVHFHGPQGTAFTSGEHLQMTASKNVVMNAGGSLSMGAMGNMTLNAGEKIGLFAHTGKLNVISGEGSVQFQAQNGAMSLSAQQKISLVSTSDMLFAGKKKVTLIGGGSYLKIEQGKIEYGTTATYLRKVERTFVGGSASQPLTFPEIHPVIQSTICIPCLLKAIQANDAIIEGL
ncbi:DUF2345 domain-containing protein [Cronobacter sakazakii]